jgi:hypothetical protein
LIEACARYNKPPSHPKLPEPIIEKEVDTLVDFIPKLQIFDNDTSEEDVSYASSSDGSNDDDNDDNYPNF